MGLPLLCSGFALVLPGFALSLPWFCHGVAIVHNLIKNCLVLRMVDEHQKLPPHEIGTKSGHLSTQFDKELPCVDHG